MVQLGNYTNFLIENNLMTSIRRVRDILGDKYKHYSDDKIRGMNDGANILADIFESVLDKEKIE